MCWSRESVCVCGAVFACVCVCVSVLTNPQHSGSWYKFALKVGLPNDVTLHFLPNDFTQVRPYLCG